MPEPITFAVVGLSVLTEGIKFLYGQAGEALKRWHERRAAASHTQGDTIPIQTTPPETVFSGHLAPLELHLNEIDQSVEENLRYFRQAITDYAEGWKPIEPNDLQMFKTVDALRKVMEVLYQQRLTFKGEERFPSGPVVEGEINAKVVNGYATGIRKEAHTDTGHYRGKVTSEHVGEHGTVIGVHMTKDGGKT